MVKQLRVLTRSEIRLLCEDHCTKIKRMQRTQQLQKGKTNASMSIISPLGNTVTIFMSLCSTHSHAKECDKISHKNRRIYAY